MSELHTNTGFRGVVLGLEAEDIVSGEAVTRRALAVTSITRAGPHPPN